jgi:hypothetical protein
MYFCPECGLKLTGNENFCPSCGIKVQQSRTTVDNIQSTRVQSTGVQHTTGDVIGAGISGSGNVILKDTRGYAYNVYGFSYEQIKNIVTSSTAISNLRNCK